MLKSIRQQGDNYWQVLKWLLSSYYRQEKLAFWLVQALMCVSVVTGLAWLLGVIAGLNFLNDPDSLLKYNIEFLADFFSLSLWKWVSILSLCGLLSALTQFLSYTVGVNSVIRYQKELMVSGLKVLVANDTSWSKRFQDPPKVHLNRVLKMGVQMSGLVVRRLVRMLIPLVTLFASTFALIKLNSTLLSLMFPLFLIYIFVLYFINRRAARNQVQLVGLSKTVMPKLGALIEEVLEVDSLAQNDLMNKIQKSGYKDFSLFRYKRRLAEIHVSWLNSFFLIFGSALIIFVEGVGAANEGVNWGQLILFVVALRYAGAGLQEMASSTVAFSRFLPETELVYQLLHAAPVKQKHMNGLIYALNLSSISDACFNKIIGQKYAVNNWFEIEDKLAQSIPEDCLISGGVCITSKRPIKFKQAVRRATGIETVLVFDGKGSLDVYTKEMFLEKFDSTTVNKNRNNNTYCSGIEEDY